MDIYAVWAASIAFAAIVCLLTLTWLHDKEIKAARLAESEGLNALRRKKVLYTSKYRIENGLRFGRGVKAAAGRWPPKLPHHLSKR